MAVIRTMSDSLCVGESITAEDKEWQSAAVLVARPRDDRLSGELVPIFGISHPVRRHWRRNQQDDAYHLLFLRDWIITGVTWM